MICNIWYVTYGMLHTVSQFVLGERTYLPNELIEVQLISSRILVVYVVNYMHQDFEIHKNVSQIHQNNDNPNLRRFQGRLGNVFRELLGIQCYFRRKSRIQ